MAISADLLAASGIDTRLLDCWEVTLAMGLIDRGHRDVRSVLGSQWWFQSSPVPGAAPRLDFDPVENRCASLAGLRPHTERVGSGELVDGCARALALGRCPMIVTDAYLLPWCPYAGRKHVAHSFAVTGIGAWPATLRVADAYDNRTEWGDARPLATEVDGALVARLEQEPTTRLITLLPEPPGEAADRTAHRTAHRTADRPLSRMSLFQANVRVLADWGASPYAEFIERCRGDVDLFAFEEFCEACWTIERRRGLYGAWLDDLAAEPDSPIPAELAARFRTTVVARWSEVNRFAYLALRRLRGGRRAVGGVADLVSAAAAAERDLAAEVVAEFSGQVAVEVSGQVATEVSGQVAAEVSGQVAAEFSGQEGRT